jgi:sirohydrochlorin ferrochelatase
MTRLIVAAGLALTAIFPSVAPAQTGLLVVAHGGGAEWNDRVRQTVAQVQWPLGPVTTAFLMGPDADSAGWAAGIETLVRAGATRIVAVPLMVSSAGSHHRQIRYYAGEIDSLPAELAEHAHGWKASVTRPTLVTRALDGSPELARVLSERWNELPEEDRRRPILVVAHGPSSDAEAAIWKSDLDRVIRPIAESARVPFAVGLLRDDAPPAVRSKAVADLRRSIGALIATGADSVTVLPVLISRSSIGTVTIPRDLQGMPIRYDPVVLAPSPHLARWIERVALARVESTN